MNLTTASQLGLHIMSKPIGPICNLDCTYCYYLQKEELYPKDEKWRMSEETLLAYISQYIAAQPEWVEEYEFSWQGGEPTLLGIDFFRRAVELQKELAPTGKRCHNSMQTNGVLLDDRWCEFLAANDFLIGLSIDGPPDLHDKYRVDKQGRPTHEKVLDGLRCLQKHGVEYNILTVVNRHNGNHPRRVYRFLKEIGTKFIQFIPIVEQLAVVTDSDDGLQILGSMPGKARSDERPEDLVSERSVKPAQWGEFLIGVFEEWVLSDVGRVYVQIFDQALAAWLGQTPSLCLFQKECGRAMAIEHNGDLFSCDHFVTPEYKLGNIHQTPIAELANSAQQLKFGTDKETTLPRYCRECEVRFVCNGECPKNRFIQTPDGQDGLNYLCEGYKNFFTHIDPVMKAMAEELRHQRPPANVMHRLKAQRRHVQAQQAQKRIDGAQLSRNDPCPCGSGRKFKKCCMARSQKG